MSVHKPVLLKEAIEFLNLKPGMTVIDATLGGGGHSQAILNSIGDRGKLVAIDLDKEAIERFKFSISNSQFSNKSQNSGNIFLVNGNFVDLKDILSEIGIERVDAILADLGWSSDQLEGKGMSFMNDERLDMRLSGKIDKNKNAEYVINSYSEKELAKIIREYGEEKYAQNIARKIAEHRKKKKIENTGELVEIIKYAVPPKYRYGKMSPATRTFQAIRIEVNRELDNLRDFLPAAIESLKTKGRLAVISFHSLEDRIVKNIFRENARGRISTDEITGRKIIEKSPAVRLISKNRLFPVIWK